MDYYRSRISKKIRNGIRLPVSCTLLLMILVTPPLVVVVVVVDYWEGTTFPFGNN